MAYELTTSDEANLPSRSAAKAGTKDKKSKDTSKDADILKQALEDYDSAYEFQRGNIDEANEDLRFRRGRKEDQWDAEALAMRGDRPCLTINGIPQFIRQVTGDMRQMRPSIKVNPVDSRGDPKTSEILAGLVRYVENRSMAKHVYTTGGDSQVACGIGHWRVNTEYASSTTFNQELRVVGIKDGVSVLWDPDSEFPTREDAMFCHVPFDISRRKFKKQYPEATAEGFAFEFTSATDGWYTGDSIRVTEYWLKKPIKRSLAMMPDGAIDDITDQTEGFNKEQLAGAAEWYKSQGIRFEQRDSFKVCRYLMTANEILEEMDWPGSQIPIVPCIGEEVYIGREVYRHGVVRYARDPQKMVNYYASADAEVTALQPKAPYLATLKQVQNHMDQWETANTQNHSVLIYDADPQAAGAPQRIAPPQASQAIQLGKAQALEDMKRVIGIYDAGLGQRSNETSGIAIQTRDKQSDTGTFVYIDNFNMAIQRTGQILLDLIPHIYDTERKIRIIGADGTEQLKDINKPQMVDGQESVLNDVTIGAYDVTLDTGPGYATRRLEAQDGMKAFLQAFPEAAPAIGDLYAKGQDWQYADEISERLQAMLPPPIKQMIDEKKKEDSPETAQEEKPQDPAEAAAKQAQDMQMAAGMAEMQAKVEKSQAEAEAAKQSARKAKADADKAEQDAKAAAVKVEQAEIDKANAHVTNLRAIEDHENEKKSKENSMAMEMEDRERGMAQEQSDREEAKFKESAETERKKGETENTKAMFSQLAKMLEDSHRGLEGRIESIIKDLNKPKRIVRDPKTNRVTGVEAAD